MASNDYLAMQPSVSDVLLMAMKSVCLVWCILHQEWFLGRQNRSQSRLHSPHQSPQEVAKGKD